MKKKLLTLIVASAFGHSLHAQNVHIPDANFKAYLLANSVINTNADAEIQVAEAAAYTGDISCSNLSIADMTGLEAFVNIWYLDCSRNDLTSLDVSANTALTQMHCWDNQLTALDVSNNTSLTYLRCRVNQLSALDVTNNTALSILQCGSNLFTTIDLSQNVNLTQLEINDNGLTALDITNSPLITNLNIQNNALTALDLSNNTSLTNLYCPNNSLTSLDISNSASLLSINCYLNAIEALDLSNNPVFVSLDASYNALTSLNIANGNNSNVSDFYVSNNPNLTCIEVDDAAYSIANWTSVDPTASFSEGCSPCVVNIPDANFKSYLLGNTAINTNGNGHIECSEAAAYSGTISVNTFSISDLTGIEAFTSITNLDCAGNSLTSLDLSANTALVILRCQANALTTLDLSANTALLDVVCHSNGLTSLTVGNLTNLENLSCGGNALTALDVTGCPALVDLRCDQNQITALDVTNSSLITNLDVSNNLLAALDLGSNTSLQFLSCWNNQLTALDVYNIPTLETIDCRLNSIVTLDFSNNPALVDIQARYNSLTSLNVANGNNTIITGFNLLDNPSLMCIEVDDAAYSTTNWIHIDATASFSENCLTVGIDAQEEVTFDLYPNPAKDVLNLQTDASINLINISDMAGRTVMTQSLNGTTNARLDVSSMESGVYLLTVTDINGITTSRRWIKK